MYIYENMCTQVFMQMTFFNNYYLLASFVCVWGGVSLSDFEICEQSRQASKPATRIPPHVLFSPLLEWQKTIPGFSPKFWVFNLV